MILYDYLWRKKSIRGLQAVDHLISVNVAPAYSISKSHRASIRCGSYRRGLWTSVGVRWWSAPGSRGQIPLTSVCCEVWPSRMGLVRACPVWRFWHCRFCCPVQQNHQRVCTDNYSVVVFFFFWFILLIILFGTAEPHTIFVLQLLYSKFKLRCVTGFVDSPLCAGVSGSFFFFFFFCLRVFFVSVSGSGTSKWAGDLYLTPCAKMCFACWLFPPSSFASSSAMFSSFMSLFVYIHSGWKSQTQKDAARNKAFLRPFLPLLFPSLKCRRSGHAWGFQTSVCVGGLWRATPP